MATDKEYKAVIDALSGECERLHKENEELKALSKEPCKGQTMTREEARDQIVIFMCDEQKVINDRDKKALEMAIQALSSWETYSDKLWKEAYERGKAEALSQEPIAEKSVQDMTELEKALLHIKTRADAWAVKVVKDALSKEPCEVSEYDKDHIWYKGGQYISLRRFLEVKAEAEKEPTERELGRDYLLQSFVEALKVLQAENDDLKEKLKIEPCTDGY